MLARLLSLTLLAGGLVCALGMRSEVFPPLDPRFVQIAVIDRAAPVEHIAENVLPALEAATSHVPGIVSRRGIAREGIGILLAELRDGVDGELVAVELQRAVDGTETLPSGSERPQIELLRDEDPVLRLMVHGWVGELALRDAAGRVREALAASEVPMTTDLQAPRLELSVEVPREVLWRERWTIDEVAGQVAEGNAQAGGGELRGRGPPVGTRGPDRVLTPSALESLTIAGEGGSSAERSVGSFARARASRADPNESLMVDGRPAIAIDVYDYQGVGPAAVSEAARATLRDLHLPLGIEVSPWADESADLSGRLDLVARNGVFGLLLALGVLGLCVAPGVAVWVALGIPVAIFGGLIPLLGVDLSINQISLFALILVSGIVIDDAIIVGESVARARSAGLLPVQASLFGLRRVCLPVICAVLTNIVAFLPLGFVPGEFGSLFGQIAWVVVVVLAVSLFESMLLLPAHLAHVPHRSSRSRRALAGPSRVCSAAMRWFADRVLAPVVRSCLHNRLAAIPVMMAVVLLGLNPLLSREIAWGFAPRVEGDIVTLDLALAEDATMTEAQAWARLIREAAHDVDGFSPTGTLERIGGFGDVAEEPGVIPGPHRIQVQAALDPASERGSSSEAYAQRWMRALPTSERVRSLSATSQAIGDRRDLAVVELSGLAEEELRRASAALAATLESWDGVRQVKSESLTRVRQIRLQDRAVSPASGLSRGEILSQLRHALRGRSIERIQTPGGEVELIVRVAPSDMESVEDLASLPIKGAHGGVVPLKSLMGIHEVAAPPVMLRRDGRPLVTLNVDLEGSQLDEEEWGARIDTELAPMMTSQYPGLSIRQAGEAEEERRSTRALARGLLLSLLACVILLAIPLRSLVQPLVLLLALPAGLAGVVQAHAVAGVDLSVVSALGTVALAGVLVNDGLVLLHAANAHLAQGLSRLDAALTALRERFRPMVLTTLTTAAGLLPMMLEDAAQAQFLVPMALAIGGGLLFATPWMCVVVPLAWYSIPGQRPRPAIAREESLY